MPPFAAPNPDYAAIVAASFAKQGLMRALGFELVEVAPGACVLSAAAEPRLTQQQGLFHGALIGAMLDCAGGYAAQRLFADLAYSPQGFCDQSIDPTLPLQLFGFGALVANRVDVNHAILINPVEPAAVIGEAQSALPVEHEAQHRAVAEGDCELGLMLARVDVEPLNQAMQCGTQPET
jgi:hypothetical protein